MGRKAVGKTQRGPKPHPIFAYREPMADCDGASKEACWRITTTKIKSFWQLYISFFVDFVYLYVYNIGMKRSENISALIELASSQWGMFTTAQAASEGVSRVQLGRMSSDGRIEPMARGTYRFASAGDVAHAGLKAAWLSLLPSKTAYERLRERPRDCMVAGRTAAVLLGDTDLHAEPYCFATEPNRRTTRTDIQLLPWIIDECDVLIADGIPVTSPERTVADLVRLREDPSLLANFVAGMGSRGYIFDRKRSAELLAPLAARNGYRKEDGDTFAENIIGRNVSDVMLNLVKKQIKGIETWTSANSPTTKRGKSA